MTATVWLLNAVRDTLPIKSDYALAKAVGISRARMSHYTREVHELTDEKVIVRAAEMAGLPLPLVLVRMSAARAQTSVVKTAWKRAAELMTAAAPV